MSTIGNEVHELPLANRIVDELIHEYVVAAAGLARCGTGTVTEYERGFQQAVDQMQHLHLAGWEYRLTPKILDALRRAGLSTDRPDQPEG